MLGSVWLLGPILRLNCLRPALCIAPDFRRLLTSLFLHRTILVDELEPLIDEASGILRNVEIFTHVEAWILRRTTQLADFTLRDDCHVRLLETLDLPSNEHDLLIGAQSYSFLTFH